MVFVGSHACTQPRMMSTKYRHPVLESHTGPSSSSPRASSASVASIAATGALFPTGFEEANPSARGRMLRADVVVQSEAESRTIGHGETAVRRLDARGMIDEIVDPRVGKIVEVLEDLVIRRRDREMHVRHRSDRSADVVRRHDERVRVGPSRETLHRQETAVVREIHLDDVDEAALDRKSTRLNS